MTTMGDPVPAEHPDGFADFYRSTAGRTFAIARRAAGGNQETAQDATQEAYAVMLQCWAERRRRDVVDNSRYVVGIAVRKVADWHRQHLRIVELEPDDDGCEDEAFGELLDKLSILEAVRDLIDHQPARRRQVAVLYFLEECSYAEIADILSITKSTARTQVERLRAQLKPLVNRINEFNRGGER